MTREQWKEILPFAAAFANGETVQRYSGIRKKWETLMEAEFSEGPLAYRIKPTPKLRSFRRGEIKCGDVVKLKSSDKECLVIATSEQGVTLGSDGWGAYEELLADYTMADGSPCGKEEEE